MHAEFDPFATPEGQAPGVAAASHPTRNRRYQAPDPSWANRELCEAVRQRLWKIDPRLNLWWNPSWPAEDVPMDRGRWCVVYWMEQGRNWSVVFYHENSDASYRPLEPELVSALIHRVEVCHLEATEALAVIKKRQDEALKRSRIQFDEGMRAFGREVNMFIGVTGQKGSARRSRALQRIEEARLERLNDLKAEKERNRQDAFKTSRGAAEFGSG